jgi:D-glycero-D-manno-heptose 1,7-bisphosphate phosphatase
MIIWIKSPEHKPRPFLLLDRDGIINEDRPDYIKHRREFRFYPDALQALRWLREHQIHVVIISNQSGLNRGIIAWEHFWGIHEEMVKGIEEAGGALLGAFYCPHRPEEACSCRKPMPGLIEAASDIFHIPLPQTDLIGDRSSDLTAAARAGCRAVLLDRSVGGIEDLLGHRHDTTLAGAPVKSFFSLMEAVLTLSETWKGTWV